MEKKDYSNHILLKNTKINDSFWSNIQNTVRNSVIPYQYLALNDQIDGAEKSYAIDNFKKAIKVVNDRKAGIKTPVYPTNEWHYTPNNSDKNAFLGWVFQDSDIYKWLEAVAYSLVTCPDKELEQKADDVIDLVCSAQLDNGYLDTLYIINNPENVFTNLRDFHELYCFGHLAEAAVAYYESTGKDKLLNATLRFADLICSTFGKGKKEGYGGHEIAELALMKLYRVTGENRYLETAEFFINARGTKPYYYDKEHNCHTENEGYHYNQAHKPPRQQTEAVGHAVRGVYLYSGMTDVAKALGDDELYSACKALWDNITNKKMYITGGIGSTVHGEAFTQNYDLPNDLAYCETCASIGLIFFGMRMLEVEANSQIADTIERALYNTVLSGMNKDGNAFFYVNPLEVLPEASHKDERKWHIKTQRQKWFGCACCPPNLARLLSSMGEYAITENKKTTYIHQFFGGEYNTNSAHIAINSDYTKTGKIEIKVTPSNKFTLAVRIPSWCENYSFNIPCDIKNGYAYFEINDKTTIKAQFNLEPKFIACSNRVRANIGKCALTYGPFVYCMEEVDNGNNLQNLIVDVKSKLDINDYNITALGIREELNDENDLYFSLTETKASPCKITFVPYYTWGNRGENEMNVYFRYKI